MNLANLRSSASLQDAGTWMHSRAQEWFGFCRSLSGEGVRQTLREIQAHIPLTVHEVPTGEGVFDWTVPNEWTIRDAYIKNASGTRVVDFAECNLHVVGYSMPVHETMSLSELKAHCHTLPERPAWVPYKTSYYSETWGFCLSQNRLDGLADGDYEVCIDASLEPGSLSYGECILPGRSEESIVISSHVCHPSLANDNLSSMVLATWLARELYELDLRFTYRFVFAPATLGAIAWLARNEEHLAKVRHGLVLACTGDPGNTTYKRSRRHDAEIDRVMEFVLAESGAPYTIVDFVPYGYDERQYCSPGFDLPMGCLMRSEPGSFPEYHTSADNLDFVQPKYLADTLGKVLRTLEILEGNDTFVNLSPKGEPQLGKRGLFEAYGGDGDRREKTQALLWVLNYSDGRHSLFDIAQRSKFDMAQIREAADRLVDAGLLERV